MKNWMDETQRNFTEEKMIKLLREALGSLTSGLIQRQLRSFPEGKQKMKTIQNMHRIITSKSKGGEEKTTSEKLISQHSNQQGERSAKIT
jgi:hypothetical protein